VREALATAADFTVRGWRWFVEELLGGVRKGVNRRGMAAGD
jgi:hypothetical protein